MGAFALRTPGTGDRFPGTPETVREYVSRLYRFLELGILIGSGPVGMLSKLREIGWESGLGVVDGENSGMAWVRPLISRDEASHFCIFETARWRLVPLCGNGNHEVDPRYAGDAVPEG